MAIPHQLGQYRIEAQLSSDRFTESYRAFDTVRRRTVLLTVLQVRRSAMLQPFQDFLSAPSVRPTWCTPAWPGYGRPDRRKVIIT